MKFGRFEITGGFVTALVRGVIMSAIGGIVVSVLWHNREAITPDMLERFMDWVMSFKQ